MKLVLEQRYLFAGDVGATVAHTFGDTHPHHPTGADAWGAGDHSDNHAGTSPTPPAIAEPHVGRSGSPETVLFVDPRVADWQELVAGVKRGVDVVMLDPNQDGISQVTQALAGLTNVKNVEFLTDGTPGSITLGGTTLDAAVLGARANEITGWSAHLASNADIIFWGCDVGQGSAGATFVSDVHTLTGATVGASSDATGAAALGGDWTLEVSTGPLHHHVNPFTEAALAGYNDVLDTPQPIVALAVTDKGLTEGGTIDLGDSITATIAIQNTAQNATGYTPFVELWVPNTLTANGPATENGVALTELTAAVTNGAAVNPLTGQTEAAPDGFTSGTLHVYELTESSLAAGGSVLQIAAGFTVTGDVSQAGKSLQIGARGGFVDGAVAGSKATIEGDTYSSTATLAVPLDPSIAIVGASNQTDFATTLFDPAGTSSGSAVTVTPGELLRMRILEQLAVGTNGSVTLQVTLPAGLTYQNDNTVTVLLVSPNGDTTTTLTGTGLQLAEGSTAIDTTKLNLGNSPDTTDPVVATLPAADIVASTASSSGQTITFNLGTLTNTETAAPLYAIIEFNGIVGAAVSNNASLTPTLSTVSGSNNTATTTVQTPYDVTNFTDVVRLPLFDSSLGALKSMTLNLTGNEVTSGTFKNNGGATSGSMTYSIRTKLSLSQDTADGGPVLPTGTPTVTTGASVNYPSGAGAGQTLTFDPAPGDSTSDPATATSGNKTVTTNLGGFESPGGGGLGVPVDINGATSAHIVASGGNFSQAINTTAQGVLSVFYTYSSTTTASTAFLTVKEPTVTLAKAITGISYSGTTATVTYVDTVSNTSSTAPAYGLTLTDTGDGNTSDTITDLNSHSGTGTSPSSSVTGGNFVATLASLPANGTETFSYTETVPIGDVATSVADSKTALATVTSFALNPAHFSPANNLTTGKETLAGSSVTPATSTVTSSAAFDSISGTVNQDTGATEGGLNPLVALSGETVSVSYPGLTGTESQQTDSSGHFTLLVPDAPGLVTLTAAVGGTLSTAVLDNHPSETGTPSPLPLSSTASETGFETSNTGAFSFTPVSGSSYSGIVFDFWKAPAANSTPSALLSIVGGSNDTAGLGTQFDPSGQTSPGVLMTDGEIVRERATLALTSGTANSSSITVTLPTNLAFDPNYATDGSVTVLLVSSDGSVTTSLTGTGLQLTDATPNTAKLDLGTGADTTDPVTTALPVSDINVSGSAVTFNLGNLKDTSGSYQAIVEFNAIVDKAVTTGTVLNTQMTGAVGALVTSTQNDFVNTQAPAVTLTKAITGISYSGTTATVTYVDTIANTSGVAAAYGLTLTDPGDGNSSDTITDLSSHSGTGTGASSSVTGGNFVATLTSLPTNGTETFSYTETVPAADVATSVADSKTAQATVTSFALNPAHFNPANNLVTGKETLANTLETPPTYSKSASAPLALVSGNVNQDLSPTEGTDGSLRGLPSQTVAVTFTGQSGTESVSTAADGSFALLVPTGAPVTITATTSTPNAPAGDVMDNDPSLTGTPSLPTASKGGFHSNPGSVTFTPASGTSYTGLAFDFWAASTPSSKLSVVGGSNNTAGLGTQFDPNGQTSPGVLMTNGEIVRERATLSLTPGSAGSASMTVTLPTNLAMDPNYATDGSVTVLLVSADGNVSTSLTGTGLQLTDATPNAAKLDLGTGADTTDPVTTALPVSDINVSGSTVTFNLGNLSDPSGNYSAVVEFNAIVDKAATTGTVLNTQMTGSANSTTTATANDFVNTQAPAVTLTKAITGISYSGSTATVSYVDTIANTSNVAAAYGLTLTDPGDGNSSDTITDLSSHSGTGTGASSSVTGGNFVATLTSLPTNGTETFSYTETVPAADVATSVADSKTAQATVTSFALNPAHFNPANNLATGKETLANTLETPPTYTATASAPFDLLAGTVNQDTSPTEGGLNPLVPLPSETVAITFPGQSGTESVTTDGSGDFSVLVPTGVVVAVTPTVSPALVLDNHPDTTGTPSLPSASTTGFETSNAPTLTFTPTAGTSYTGVSFDFWAPPATATLSVVGGSNDTAGLGTQFDPSGQTSPGVLMTDGEIVRERATLNLGGGVANATSMTVTLPTNLALDPNYATDGSVTVLLVSSDGAVTTTLTGSGLQLTDASPNAAKLDLGTGADTTDPVTTALPVSDINVSGNTVTFNLGNLNDAAGSYHAIVEFNAIVDKAATTGTVLNTQMTGSANSTSTATVNDYVNTQTPTVTLTKAITGISYSSTTATATVTYVDTIANTSGVAAAYGLTLTDPGDGNTSDTITDLSSHSGTGTGASSSVTGGNFVATLTSLPTNGTETFSYTETVPAADVATSVVDSKTALATVTSFALNPAHFNPANNLATGKETLVNTLETPPTYTATASAPFDLLSGTVNQDTGATEGGLNPLVPLPSETVAVTFPGQSGTESVTTDSSGDFSVLVPTGVAVSVTPTVSPALVLDNHPDTTGTPSLPSASTTGFETSHTPTLTFTPTSGTSYTGVTFDFWAPTATLSVVGGSNDTAGLGTQFDPNGQTSPGVLMTDGEIVRERATLNLGGGAANAVSMTVTLPSNLTIDPNYQTDGSVTVLLVSADGSVTTTLTGSGLQLTDASPNAAKLDLGTGADTTDPVTTVLPSSQIPDPVGNTVTFNLGNLSDGAGPYQAIVEFNAVVSPTAPTGDPTDVLNTQMAASANGSSTLTVNDYVHPQVPAVTLSKAITGFSTAGGTTTVTYVDTVTSTSPVAAYGLTLTDVGDGNTSDTITDIHSHAGNGVGANSSVTGGNFVATLTSLPGNGAESFTYTETVPAADLATSVADSKTALATLTSFDLNPALFSPANNLATGKEVLVGTSVTPLVHTLTKTAPFGLVSGTVNQDTSSTEGGLSPLNPLPNETVVIQFPGGSETVQTDSHGNFTAPIPADVAVTITPTVDPSLVLDNHPETTGTPGLPGASTSGFESSNSPTLTFTPAGGTAYTGVTFDFWKSTQKPPVFSNNVTPALVIPEIPLIPQLALIGSVDNRFIIEDQQAVIQVPPDIFIDSDPNAELIYDAKLPDGTPLPSWLHFDANNLTFSGTPPLFSRGRIEITITAKDQWGNTAEASFSILIGQKEEDLSKLLLQSNQTPGTFQPYGFQFGFQASDAAPVPPPRASQPTQLADTDALHLHEAVHRADTWRTASQVKQAGDFGGFSKALRNAGNIGALSRARALLDSLDKLAQARPSI